METEVEQVEAKHIFIDIVNYTHNRSIEAQSDIIKKLNDIVKEAVKKEEINEKQKIYIPTGDGMCISLINILKPFDIHIKLALSILEKLDYYNHGIEDEKRKFKIRIGINENIDNLIIDINGRENISGKGINFASRIEGLCDESQILVGDTVFDKLNQREAYMNSFKTYTTHVKHNIPLNVHQFINTNLNYLNNTIPKEFEIKEIKEIKETEEELTEFELCYLSICHIYSNFIEDYYKKSSHSTRKESLHILMYYLTEDIIELRNNKKVSPSLRQKIKYNHNSLESFLLYLDDVHFWLLIDLSDFFIDKLQNISEYFDMHLNEYLFIHQNKKEKVKEIIFELEEKGYNLNPIKIYENLNI